MTKAQAKSAIVEPTITVSKMPTKPKPMARASLLATADAAKTSKPKSAKKPAPLPYPADASKQDRMIALLKQPAGATTEELITATGWQTHSIRGFLSATVRKKLQLPLVAELRPSGERVYRIAGDRV